VSGRGEQKLFEFICDLHLHTCLSPCGSLGASPRGQMLAAAARGIDMVAICDHNTADNVDACRRAAVDTGMVVLAGMEVCSAEEVHSLAIMPDVEAALSLQEVIWANLPGHNDPDVFGMQVVADHEDNVLGFCDRLLIGATQLGLPAVAREVRDRGGLLIAAHVDREGYGVIAQLGFVPRDTYDALEVSARGDVGMYRDEAERLGVPLLRNSDAHDPDDVGRVTTRIRMAHRTFDELKMALRGEAGREVIQD